MDDVKENALLPVDRPRTVVLKGKNQQFVYVLRRITADDWTKYFAGIVDQALQVGGVRERVYDADTAMADLVNRVLVRVEGYGDLSAVADWKAAIPPRHRLAVGIALRSVAPAEHNDCDLQLCDLVEIKLNATWPVEGMSCGYDGLIHRFRHPSIEQLKRFNFEAARIRVRGNGENGISVYPSRMATAMSLYDELIESVDGYSVNGEPIATVEEIRANMDGMHKAVAALELFEGDDDLTIQ